MIHSADVGRGVIGVIDVTSLMVCILLYFCFSIGLPTLTIWNLWANNALAWIILLILVS